MPDDNVVDARFRPFREIAITIADDEWELCGWAGPDEPLNSDRIVFSGALVINGTPMHLEGWAVEEAEDGSQEPASDEDGFTAIYGAVGADGCWRTVNVGGREYALVATPYCD